MSHAFAGKLLIRPVGEPGRCRRTETTSQPQGTPEGGQMLEESVSNAGTDPGSRPP